MLFPTDDHQALNEGEWDQTEVEQTIRQILTLTYQWLGKSSLFWPIHPKDRIENCNLISYTDFYFGAAGVLWALNELRTYCDPASKIDFPDAINKVLQHHLVLNDPLYEVRGSYFVGEAGIRAVSESLAPSINGLKALKQCLREHEANPYNEVMYGCPGSLLIATHLFERTGDEDFRTFSLSGQDHLLKKRLRTHSGLLLWEQVINENKRHLIGAAHGTVGNYGVLLRGLTLFPNEVTTQEIIGDVSEFLIKTQVSEGPLCNWPMLPAEDGDSKLLVQWCHGAPGIVTTLASSEISSKSQSLTQLLLQAGELIWRAGPLTKGASLCHGTSGSGMAFLKLFEMTHDKMWLQRARKFAMHAIHQFNEDLQQTGHPRFSLWTGDLGLALFLRDSIRAKALCPGIDHL